LLPYQSNGNITNNLQALSAHLVDRVFSRVPVWIVEIHHVDRVDADLLQRYMIVGECMPDSRDELVLIAAVGGNSPDSLHDLGRVAADRGYEHQFVPGDRKSTRLNSSHLGISYAVSCLKKKEDT